MNRELVICRNVKQLSKIKPRSGTHYIVASDDITVQKIAIQFHWVNMVCWIEDMESFFNVAEDVKSFVDIINDWLATLSEDNELLFWIKHAEGGLTTQRIQDALLLIRSYINLIEKTHPDSITILSNANGVWVDDILIKTANSRDIPVKTIGRRHRDVKSFIKLFLREPYYITRFLQSKYSMVWKSKGCEKEIVFQLCSSERKHLAHTTPLMESLYCKGYNPIALCWATPGCAMKLKDMHLEAEYLEKYGSLMSIISGEYKLINICKNATNQKRALIEKLLYKNVQLGDALWPSIQFFLSNSVGQRYRLRSAIKNYFTQHDPDAMRFWTTTFPEGTIPLKMLPSTHRPVIFGNTGFHDLLDNPYNNNDDMLALDLKLVTGQKQKIKDDGNTGPDNKISIIGQVSWEHYNKNISKEQSLKHLSIPDVYRKYIIYDAGTVLRGFLSVQEQSLTLKTLLEFAEEHAEVALLIKPHPNHTQGILEAMIAAHGLKNIYLIDKSKTIFDCINVADFLITKWSTTGIEAMYLNTPVVSVCLDKERKFAIYGNAAHYIYEIEDLRILLNHEAFTPQWKEDLNCRAALFLNENFYQPEHMTPSQIGADEIISTIQSRSIS